MVTSIMPLSWDDEPLERRGPSWAYRRDDEGDLRVKVPKSPAARERIEEVERMWLARVPEDLIVEEIAEKYDVAESLVKADITRVRRDVLADIPVTDVTKMRIALAEMAMGRYTMCIARAQKAVEEEAAAKWIDLAGKESDRLARWFGINQDKVDVTHQVAMLTGAELDRAIAEAARSYVAQLPQVERAKLLGAADPEPTTPEQKFIDAVATAEVVQR